ncbi:MAG: flagellar biosynthesis protein FlhA [Pseudomonadota bacterium]
MELAKQRPYAGQIPFLTNNSELLMPLGLVGILCVMLIPIPAFLLDLMLSLNITISLVILLVGMYVLKPLEFGAFPSVLLLTTLFRLSLNVASTRMILLHGNEGTSAAGKVINAFGNFVVGGNYVIGIIVFIILVLINFMVITKGAGRIAEVAARFTLDAMPGKQMSIDADLNAGIIDEDEAKARRLEIARESEYYGAMDGANKFVKGDAVAGMIITGINIVGGLIIGVFQNDMSFADAAQNYTLLTVGDGLVSQIPALIISTAAGIIVTRAGAEASLGREVAEQIFNQPRAIAVASVVLIGFGLIPGLPTVPFMSLGILSGTLAYFLFKAGKEGEASERDMIEAAEVKALPGAQVQPLPPLDILSLEIGYGLIPLVDMEQDGELLDRIKAIRRQMVQDIGIVVPSIHIQDNMQFRPGEYAIFLKGNVVAKGELMTNHFLAMNAGTAVDTIDGIPTTEPTYGLPALWIRESVREKAIAAGYTVVDLATVLTTHLSDVINRHAHELLGRQEAQHLLDKLKETHPKVVDELVPNLVSLGGVVKVLKNLLREQVPIRDLLAILETLADWAPVSKDFELLTEYVRQALSRTITGMHQGHQDTLAVITLDQSVESAVADAIQHTQQGSYLTIDPKTAQLIAEKLSVALNQYKERHENPVVLCSAPIRLHVKKLLDRFFPNLSVISYEEILTNANIQALGTVTL